jgi:hypothetical protein
MELFRRVFFLPSDSSVALNLPRKISDYPEIVNAEEEAAAPEVMILFDINSAKLDSSLDVDKATLFFRHFSSFREKPRA